VLGGGQLMFHPTDWLGIGAWGGFTFLHIDSSLTDEISAKGQVNEVNVLSLPNADHFSDQIATIQYMFAPQVAFIPLRGKLGIFEKLFVDTDFYVLGGIAFVGVKERDEVDQGEFTACHGSGAPNPLTQQIRCFEDTQGEQKARMAMAPTFGVGLSLFMADWVAMTLEWRAMPFAWNTSGTDESGDPHGDFPDEQINEDDRLSHFNHMLTLGFAFYLPTEPGRSYMDDEDAAKADSKGDSGSSDGEAHASGSLSVGSKKKKKD
jgi:hypothetical protein